MQLKIYSIRDGKAECFNTPFFQGTHGEAERTFRNLVKDEKSMVSQFPDDFDLYYVGNYDKNKGTIESLDTPQHMLKAVNVVNQNQLTRDNV